MEDGGPVFHTVWEPAIFHHFLGGSCLLLPLKRRTGRSRSVESSLYICLSPSSAFRPPNDLCLGLCVSFFLRASCFLDSLLLTVRGAIRFHCGSWRLTSLSGVQPYARAPFFYFGELEEAPHSKGNSKFVVHPTQSQPCRAGNDRAQIHAVTESYHSCARSDLGSR